MVDTPATALVNARIILADSAAKGVSVVEGGIIRDVGPATAVPEGARVIDVGVTTSRPA